MKPEHMISFDFENPPLPLHRTERGGLITYHGPGQLVGYPLLDLNRFKKALHWYLRQMEEVVIRTLQDYDVPSIRDEGYTGVWVPSTSDHGSTETHAKKISAMGIAVSKWKTYHGFALNVNMDLAPFDDIVPCGIEGRGVCNLSEYAADVTVDDVRARVMSNFGDVFDANIVDKGWTCPI